LRNWEDKTDAELEELRDLKEELRVIDCERDYLTFFKDAWKVIEHGNDLKVGPHIEYVCGVLGDQIRKLSEGRNADYKKIIINIPPSSSKSTMVTKILPAWCWVLWPGMKIMTSSFDDRLATDHALKSRDIIQSEWFQDRWGHLFRLRSDQNEKKSYYNDKGGIRKAVTTKGPKTGFHCHLYVEDDPIDPHKAMSRIERETAIRDHDEVIPSRVLEGGLRIVVMQRLHEDDTTGHALKKDKGDILHICLPAEKNENVSPEDANEIYVDGLLDPLRFSRDRLAGFKSDLGSEAYSGQYGQKPYSPGGNKVKTEWFEFIDRGQVPAIVWDMWIDGAYTKKTENDPTGIMIAGMHRGTMYVRHFEEKRMEMPELIENIKEKADLFELGGRSRVYIEPKASGKTIRQMLRKETHLSAIEIKGHLVQEGKEARIQVAAPKIESGRVLLVKGSWNDLFVGQLIGFPRADHDEAVDLVGYACDRYFMRRKRRRGVRY